MNLQPKHEVLIWVTALVVISASRFALLEQSSGWQIVLTLAVLATMCVRVFVLLWKHS